MYHMTLSAESRGFLDFTPPIPEQYRHRLREQRHRHQIRRRQEFQRLRRHSQESISIKSKFFSTLARYSSTFPSKKPHRE